MIDQSLGPYKIIEQLGAGGMGEVYLAEDTRLGRKVAIKVLPVEFASDPERLARFEQEARAAAALNHPHIAAVFDVGAEDLEDGSGTTHFMVQEYLEGGTLRVPLKKGALSLGKALLLAREVAEALAAAHEAGIVHRDLKPDNIFITKDGHAKILDFGLAKLTEIAGPGGKELSMSPTVLGTVAGQVMGTAGYMAPEQIEGEEELDARADLFAFGCVLYEMISGTRAFGGENVLDTLHAIARTEPQSIGELDPEMPAELERIVKKCLAKARDHRYQHAADVLVDLRNLAGEVEAGTAVSASAQADTGGAPVVAPGLPWKMAVPAAVAIAAAAILGTWFFAGPPAVEPDPIYRFTLALPEGIGFSALGRHSVAISPQGTHIAFSASGQVWVRAVDDPEAAPLRGSEGGATSPFFSPDGQSIGFFAQGELRKVSIGGGAAVKLCDAANPFGVRWEDDGYIVYGQGTEGLWRVSADGGEPEQLIDTEGGWGHGPQTLSDGSILYTFSPSDAPTWDDSQIVVQALTEEEPTVLVSGGRDARYVPTGHIVYALEDAVLARPFDVETREIGGAVPLLQEVMAAFEVTPAGQFSISGRGDIVYIPGGDAVAFPTGSLVWRDAGGEVEVISESTRPGRTWTPRLSPDGRYVAYRIDDDQGEQNIWLLDLARGIHSLFTPGGGARSFAWSPDGEWLYYSADPEGNTNIYRRHADMRDDAEEFLGGEGNELVRSISPDGEWLLYADTDILSDGAYDIDVVSLTEPGDSQPVFERSVQEVTAAFSPNGKWVAFVSEESGERRVYVQSFPNLGGITQVSGDLGTEPVWSPDSRQLFYRSGTDVMVVDVTNDDPFDVGAPRLFLDDVFPEFDEQNAGSFGISSDGRRLLMIDYPDDADDGGPPPGINVVLNWFQELTERVPTGR